MKRRFCMLLVVGLLVLSFSGCGSKEGKIVIASKQFTENILMSELYAQLVENRTELKVERKQNLGGTSVIFPAMSKGDVDMYLEYTGTAYNEILKLGSVNELSSDEVYETSKKQMNEKHGITMFQPIGINNTFALAMLKSKADELGIASMSDLAGAASQLRFGANHIFYTREADGFDAMSNIYGYSFKEALRMDTSLLYEAIAQGQLDVIVVYATDSLLKKFVMVVLKDDKEMFPAYHATPVCINDTLKKHPELAEVFDLLAGKFDDALMQELNYRVDVENQTPEVVAKEFLTKQNLLK